MNNREEQKEIPVLFLRGDKDLCRATQITDKHEYVKWRAAGLKYIKVGKAFYYDTQEVRSFVKKFYELQNVKTELIKNT